MFAVCCLIFAVCAAAPAHAAFQCNVKTYTSCNSPLTLSNGNCVSCTGNIDGGGNCIISMNTVFRDNAGTFQFPKNIRLE